MPKKSNKVPKRYIDQLTKVWDDLYEEAYDAMQYVDCGNHCDGYYVGILNRLQDRFDKAIAHFKDERGNRNGNDKRG